MKSSIYILFLIVFLFSCTTNNQPELDGVDENEQVVESEFNDKELREKFDYYEKLSESEQDSLIVDLASFIIRKPAAATWETKFNPEFRSYFVKNASELQMLYLTQQADTFYFYLLRDARTVEGIKQRGVGGKYIYNQNSIISNFEEVFVTKVLPESDLKMIGGEYMNLALVKSDLTTFLSKNEHIEWPDGRLFYSKEKYEWRYVD